jgi:hypothetical protein
LHLPRAPRQPRPRLDGAHPFRAAGGCVRLASPPARLPRRYRCQSDLALAARAKALGLARPTISRGRARVEARMVPTFRSLRFGDPAYARLDLHGGGDPRRGTTAPRWAPSTICTTAAEPTADEPDEYLRFGLEAGVFFAS